METGELLQCLSAQGHQLAKSGNTEDVAKGVGLILLALEQILRASSSADGGSPAPPAATFKAKSNRW